MRARRDREFEDWVRGHRGGFLRTATTLTGGDVHLAEDLVQTSLVRLYTAWPRARRMQVDAYARRILINNLIDEKRRPFGRREQVRPQLPEHPAADRTDDLDLALMTALRALPAGMRAAVVLRHVEGLSVEETADALGATVSTVRSQTSRGLDKLRASLGASTTTSVRKGQDLCTS